MRRIIRTMLRGIGFRAVEEAPDGEEAAGLIRSHDTQPVISDWYMDPVRAATLRTSPVKVFGAF